jgi:hypothetical protein
MSKNLEQDASKSRRDFLRLLSAGAFIAASPLRSKAQIQAQTVVIILSLDYESPVSLSPKFVSLIIDARLA